VKGWVECFSTLSEAKKLLLLFVAALIVRTIGINFGYLHGDERIDSAARALSGDLVPNQHFYPPLLNYITAVFFALLYGLGRLIPVWYDLAEFRQQYFSDPLPFYLTARLVVNLFSAALAPLFYLIAKELGFSKSLALLVGVFGIFIPGIVVFTHIAKSDVPLAATTVLVFYILLLKTRIPNSLWVDIVLGVSVSMALSFKHSYVFMLAPLALLFLVFFHQQQKDLSLTLRSVTRVALAAIISWIVFNIGVLLDFQNFLEFQKIQAVMSVREGHSFVDSLGKWLSIVGDYVQGVNILVVLVFLLFPVIYLKPFNLEKNTALMLVFWGSTVVGTLFIVKISGTRQQGGLWLPYICAMQLFAVLLLCHLIQSAHKFVRAIACVAIIVALAFSLVGSWTGLQMALARPMIDKLDAFVEERYQQTQTKILTGIDLTLQQTQAMSAAEYARHERVAKKYEIQLPVRAAERLQTQDDSNAVNYFTMPIVMHGLEFADDEDLKGMVKPYAWPFQHEEWQLDYWLAQGFEVFILSDHDYALSISTVEPIKRFHTEIFNRCEQVAYFAPVKKVFVEFSATVYECRQARDVKPRKRS
ncbi:MAG: phospholipid carrier-dependent glycosyltransferase, partial [Cellvibrionaceae bacterium]|nr:phospholipid carrier-dependent glycosyltransferase [Cellvibrionaceae bacterium]